MNDRHLLRASALAVAMAATCQASPAVAGSASSPNLAAWLARTAAGDIGALRADRYAPFAFAGVGDRALSTSGDGVMEIPFAPLWTEQRVIAADGVANDLFGFRVLVTGDTAFVSAPAPIYRPGKVYVYTNVAGTWTQTQVIVPTPASEPPPGWSDFFGWSLSRSGDRLLIGAPFAFDTMLGPIGSAYVFEVSDGSWTQVAQLSADAPTATDYFGWAVALSGDTAVVGSNSYNRGANGTEGAAYVFKDSGGSWDQTQLLESSDSSPGDGRQFGSAIEFDGTTLLVSSPGADYSSTGVYLQGAAYVFENSGGTWTETERLLASDGADGDQFGFSLALDGTRALIGAPAANVDGAIHQGALYVFDRSGGTWSESARLVAPDGIAYDQLGQSVALKGDLALGGMWSRDDDPNHPPAPPRQGSVHVFEASGGAWDATDTLASSAGTTGDSFGWDVDLDGATVLVGSQEGVGGNTFQGAAYFYVPDMPPVAEIAPGSLDVDVEAGASASATLTIANAGGGSLDYAITEAPVARVDLRASSHAIPAAGVTGDDCSNPADVPWLDATPASGSIASGTSSDVTVTVDAGQLDAGSYSASLCVTTNDPDQALIAVPVAVTVAPSDVIFADGFDEP